MGEFLLMLIMLLWYLIKGIFWLITWPFRALWRKHKERQWQNRRDAESAMEQLVKERKIRSSQDKVDQVFNSGIKAHFENISRLPKKIILYYDRLEYSSDIDGPVFTYPYCKALEWWSNYWTDDGYSSNDFNELYYLAQKINALSGGKYFLRQELKETISHPLEGVTAYHLIQWHIEMVL